MGMAIWAALLEFDKSILPFYESLTTEAYYTIAVFIGMTVAVPYRSLYQIANPVLAKAIAEKDTARQEDLSCKSSMNSLILCGGLFLLINCNIHDIYRLLPSGYEAGVSVVLIISLAKLFDSISGLAGSFIVYSRYFRWDLVFSFCLMASVIGSNLYFIPRWGMNGAAVSTLISLLLQFAASGGIKIAIDTACLAKRYMNIDACHGMLMDICCKNSLLAGEYIGFRDI